MVRAHDGLLRPLFTFSSLELQGKALFQRRYIGLAIPCGGIRKYTQIRDLSSHRWQSGPDLWGDLPCIEISFHPAQSHNDPLAVPTGNY